jgi:hypothetical protein
MIKVTHLIAARKLREREEGAREKTRHMPFKSMTPSDLLPPVRPHL